MIIPGQITINDVVSAIDKKEILLPAIQREFVWKKEQITNLFDSLMCDYPIGSFLFWEVKKEKFKDYEFYEFIKDYHVTSAIHNIKTKKPVLEKMIGILDGQQRMSAFYIGLKGSITEKKPGVTKKIKEEDNPEDLYDKKYLFLDLLFQLDEDKRSDENEYQFEFYTDDKVGKLNQNKNEYWFKVRDIIEKFDLNKDKIADYVEDTFYDYGKDELKLARSRLWKLSDVLVNKSTIEYKIVSSDDDVKSDELERVLHIFIRANTGGTKLVYSDLLLSIATAQWKKKDAREEITNFVEQINKIGNKFDFNKDFVLRSCLVLNEKLDSIQFKSSNFTKNNMKIIEENWEQTSKHIKNSVFLLSSMGYNYEHLPQHLPVIPLAHYLSKKDDKYVKKLISSADGTFVTEKKNIQKYLTAAILKRVFSRHSEDSLTRCREIFKKPSKIKKGRKIIDQFEQFPLDELKEKFSEPRSLLFNDKYIDYVFSHSYKEKYSFSILALFYPNKNFKDQFHLDHIYPVSIFTDAKLKALGVSNPATRKLYIEQCNQIPNLQLLDDLVNQEKSEKMPEDWLKTFKSDERRSAYKNEHFIPHNIELTMKNFEKFFNARHRLMKKEFTNKMSGFIIE